MQPAGTDLARVDVVQGFAQVPNVRVIHQMRVNGERPVIDRQQVDALPRGRAQQSGSRATSAAEEINGALHPGFGGGLPIGGRRAIVS